ncbi:MAG TPA: NAD(P)-binding domain-containing protein [Rhizomicrobium sp.]|nr:NAD(P)-binding domain-containing protein [Rhizomicrobium sp.]
MTNASPFPLSRRALLDLLAGAALSSFAASRVSAQALVDMKIATIGSGREGGALGTLFAKLGHPVLFSSLHPEELKDLVAAAGPKARAGTSADAVAFGDVIFLAVPYTAVEQIGRDFGAALAAKPLVLDVSNPVPARDGQDFFNKIMSEGGPGLVSKKLLHDARIVRGFNAIGGGQLASLSQRPADQRVGVPIAGDDQKAIDLADRLIREAGFEPVLVGGLAKGKYLVPGTPLAGVHTPAELRQIAAGLT